MQKPLIFKSFLKYVYAILSPAFARSLKISLKRCALCANDCNTPSRGMYVRSAILVKGRIEKRERARRGPRKKARRRIPKKKRYTRSRQTREKEIPITLSRRRLQPCRLRLPLLPFPARTPRAAYTLASFVSSSSFSLVSPLDRRG